MYNIFVQMKQAKAKSTESSATFYEVKLDPKSPVRADEVTVYGTLGPFLRQARLRRQVSLRDVALEAGVSPMYLSLLERGACGSPKDDKLRALARVLGTQEAPLFATAGRVHPSIAQIILRHPAEWTALIEAGKNLGSAQLGKLRDVILASAGAGERASEVDARKRQMPHLRKQGEQVAPDRTHVDAYNWGPLAAPAKDAKIRREQLRAIVEAAEKEERRRHQFGSEGKFASS